MQFCSCSVELACSHCGGVCVTCGPKYYECVHAFWAWPDNRFEDCVICERSFCYGCSEDTTNLDERLPLGLICGDCSSEMQTECTQCGTIISNWYSRCEECERTTIPDGDANNSDTNETNTDWQLQRACTTEHTATHTHKITPPLPLSNWDLHRRLLRNLRNNINNLTKTYIRNWNIPNTHTRRHYKLTDHFTCTRNNNIPKTCTCKKQTNNNSPKMEINPTPNKS